jgi:Holliday junction DNA helicase RuvA
VGPKLAARILMELKDKAEKGILVEGTEKNISLPSAPSPLSFAPLVDKREEDATSALVNLGYKPFEARQVIRHLLHQQGPDLALNDLIRQGLQALVSGNRLQGESL